MMTDTSPAAVSAMIDLLKRRYGNLTGGEKQDAAKMIAALSAERDAANQRHAAALEAVERARGAALVDALEVVIDHTPDRPLQARAKARAIYDDIAALRTQAPEPAHPDDTAVDRFATSMKAKLKYSREEKGRGGWKDAPTEALSVLLREHVDKGDPLDVGNLAMMLHQRGDKIEPARVTVQEAALVALSSAVRQRDMEAACDALDKFDAALGRALRAIAGGRDE